MDLSLDLSDINSFDILSEFDALDDITLSQAIEKYDVKNEIDDADPMDILYGNFDLKLPDCLQIPETENKNQQRFAKPVTGQDVLDLHKQEQSINTRRNTKWAYQTFTDWRMNRNSLTGEIICDICDMSASDMDYALSLFVMEARRKDGTEYPGRTLYQIMSGLLRHCRECGKIDCNFLDEKDYRFSCLRKTLDSRMKQLAKQGIGIHTKQADPISVDDENVLWEKGLLGLETSNSLLNTAFFYNCKLFGLRGFDEHRELTRNQIEIGQDAQGYYISFRGKCSKTYKGGLQSTKAGR